MYMAVAQPGLYSTWTDAAQHASAAFVCNAIMATVICAGGSLFLLLRRSTGRAKPWFTRACLLLLALALAVWTRRNILAQGQFFASAGRWPYLALLPLAITFVFGFAKLARQPIPASPKLLSAVFAVLAGAFQWTLLSEKSIRYGGLRIATSITLILAGVAGAAILVHAGIRFRRFVTVLAATSIFGAALLLLLRPPTSGVRAATLVAGGGERLFIRHVLWPRADRDGDGSPGMFWGPDPNDRDPAVTPATPGDGPADIVINGRPIRFERQHYTVADPPTRNLLWIMLDAVRADTFTSLLDATPALRHALKDFAWYREYRSCSSKTSIVLRQLLAAPVGRQGILEELNANGYDTVRFGMYPHDSPPMFKWTFPQEPDSQAAERAKGWILHREPDAPPAFVFLHLKAGHHPVEAPGGTRRARYESAVASTLALVTEILEQVHGDWVVVISSDHGEAFGERGLYYHANSLYDDLLRVPFLLRAPGIRPDAHPEAVGCPEIRLKIRRALAGLADGADVATFQAASLNVPRFLLFGTEWDLRMRALTVGSLKAIWDVNVNLWQLYDLAGDPRETEDLAHTRLDLLAPFIDAFKKATTAGVFDEDR
jgi:hypothetical protein